MNVAASPSPTRSRWRRIVDFLLLLLLLLPGAILFSLLAAAAIEILLKELHVSVTQPASISALRAVQSLLKGVAPELDFSELGAPFPDLTWVPWCFWNGAPQAIRRLLPQAARPAEQCSPLVEIPRQP